LSFLILYEDNNIIAADKPEGLASISENDTSIETLHSLLEKKYNQKLLIVHRLDKEVSGVILFARNSKTHKHLNDQFANRAVKKYYIALTHGIMPKEKGVINKPIREFGSGRMGVDEKKGKLSSTAYKVLEKFDNYSLVELNPSTGRRHQLRVHLYFIGHPIVGDTRYGDKEIQQKYPRLMLHAKSLEFNSIDNKSIFIESTIPGSFNECILNLKNTNG